MKPSSFYGVIVSQQSAEQMHQPLFPLLLRFWCWLGGLGTGGYATGELWIRTPSALFAAGAVFASWRLARSVTTAWPALGAGALVATSPLLAWYGKDCSPYALLALLGALSFLSAQHLALSPSRRGAIRTGVLLALAFYTHFHGAWLAVIVGAWLLAAPGHPRRHVWQVTATTAALCLPALGLLVDKLLVSVRGLGEDRAAMRYSHALDEAIPEAFRVLFGGEYFAFLVLLALAVLGAHRADTGLRRLAVIAAVIALLAELHITWQVHRAKGILYVDIRHYVFLAPLLAALISRAARWAPALAVAVQLSTSLPILTGHLDKPAAREAVAYVERYANGPEHAVSYLPAPWYSGIVEYYLLGVCPALVHGHSFDGWWERGTCALSETAEPGRVFGFPFGTERVWKAHRHRELRWLWLIDLRDHRFGLPVAPSAAQEDFACWPGLADAVVMRRQFGPWATVQLIDLVKLDALGAPPELEHPARTVRAAEPWPIHCDGALTAPK